MMFQPGPRARSAIRALLPLAIALVPSAQAPDVASFDGFGLSRDGQALWAAGPAYKARFDRGGLVFTPVLGEAAARELSLGFAFESAHRGDRMLVRARGDAAPSAGGAQVVYDHPGGLREVYDVDRSGIEQSFVLDARPPGDGDLVVRGRITTELEPVATPGGLRFDHPDRGGVRIGGVLGIDAAGRTVDGSLRLDGDLLELALPDAFLDSASYPVILDPPIEPVVPVSGADGAFDPDVAYDAASDVYLVVWERRLSAESRDVAAQRVDPDGAPVGGLIAIELGAQAGFQPTVASCRSTGRFLVAWVEGDVSDGSGRLVGRSVDAATGGTSAAVELSPLVTDQRGPDAGGNVTTTGKEVVVAWTSGAEDGDGSVLVRRVDVPSSGDPTPMGDALELGEASVSTRPAISKSGGATGSYLVAWHRYQELGPTGDLDLFVRRVDASAAALGPVVEVLPEETNAKRDPDVDGDGRDFLVVWEQYDAKLGGEPDLWAVPVRAVAGGAEVGAAAVIAGSSEAEELEPAVGWNGEACAVAWIEQEGFLLRPKMVAVDPYTGVVCEPASHLDETLSFKYELELATARSGAAAPGDDRGLAVWRSTSLTAGDARIEAVALATEGGLVTPLGGGCGAGGQAAATCAVVGNGEFTLRLLDALPNGPAWLVLSADVLGFPCGPCELVADPFGGFVVEVETDAEGDAELALALPADPDLAGLRFVAQWAVAAGAVATCPLFSADLSDALSVQIQ